MRNRRRCGLAAAAVVSLCAGLAQAQTAPLPTRDVVYQMDTGALTNNGANQAEGATHVFFRQVRVAGAPWLRLKFDEVLLSGDLNAGNASYIQVTSMLDGEVQRHDARSLQDWGNSSAYFNGDTVTIEVYAFPGTGASRVTMSHVWAGTNEGFGPSESICGSDERIAANDNRQGRIMPMGCTGWLISNGSCANRFLTAGHCMNAGQQNLLVEFNVPLSTGTGTLVHPGVSDQFPIIASSIQSTGDAGIGVDAAQFFTGANNLGEHARNRMGAGAYTVASSAPTGAGLNIRVTGFGTDDEPTKTQTQQTNTGPSVAKVGTNIRYTVDTEGGNSGSPVVTTSNGLAIGIHTHAGCGAGGGHNNGTAIEFGTLQGYLANPLGPCAPLATAGRGAPLTEGGFSDYFNRAGGALGNGWTGATGDFAISGEEGTHAGATSFIESTMYEGDVRSSVQWINALVNGTTDQFVAVAGGMGGSTYFYVKLQAQTGSGRFSHIGFYQDGSGPWPGGAAFGALTSEVLNARMRVSVSADGDTVTCDLDTNFDGVPDQTYKSAGLNSISAGFGDRFGIGAWQSATFDNWGVTHAGETDGFNRNNGGMSGPWASSAGTFGNFSVSGNAGTHANNQFDTMRYTGATGDFRSKTQWIDVRAGSGTHAVGLVAGLGGSDNLFVKIQNNDSTADNFDRVFFYHGPTGGGAGWPGMTPSAIFNDLSRPTNEARIRLSVSADGNVATLDIDDDFDGVPDETFSRGGLGSISGSFGTQFGVSAYGNASFDNYALLDNATDLFNRASGAIGGTWGAGAGPIGNFSVSANRGNYTGGAVAGTIINNGVGGSITGNAQWLDVYLDSGASTSFVALLAGLGGTDNLFVKIQNNGGASDFDRVFFYHGPTGGGSGWPNMDPPAIFEDLATPVTSARIRVEIGSDGDTVTLQIDNDFDGVPDETYKRTGLSNITGNFGNRYGIGAFGGIGFDNWKATPATAAASCYPDCNGDGLLNLSDFGCFTTQFALGQPYADCNGDGVRNLSDFGCFTTKFALGCP